MANGANQEIQAPSSHPIRFDKIPEQPGTNEFQDSSFREYWFSIMADCRSSSSFCS
jgi:hypothetical protein